MPPSQIIIANILIGITHITVSSLRVALPLLLTTAAARKQANARRTDPIGNRARKIRHMIKPVRSLCRFGARRIGDEEGLSLEVTLPPDYA